MPGKSPIGADDSEIDSQSPNGLRHKGLATGRASKHKIHYRTLAVARGRFAAPRLWSDNVRYVRFAQDGKRPRIYGENGPRIALFGVLNPPPGTKPMVREFPLLSGKHAKTAHESPFLGF
jgi:hypothetical protein